MSRPGRPRDDLLLPCEIALGLVTATAVVGMHRLFADGTYWWPLFLQVVVAHTVIAALRRAGAGLLLTGAVSVVAATVFIAWTRFPDTTHWLLPTGQTLSRAVDDMHAAWTVFGDVQAPAPVENGFIAATAAAIWAIAYVADWAAFRVGVTLEAVLPATTLFVFSAALGGPGSPWASAAVFSAATLMYALLHRTATQERSSRWAGGHRAHGRWSLVGTGSAIIGMAVVVGAVAGPNMPGADSEALLAWRELTQDQPTRTVLSPIVELQTRLVEQPDVELFSVRSERASYWRLTALDEFDGNLWKSTYSTEDAQGTLPRTIDPAAAAETVTQEFSIRALSRVWLPAAFEPVAIDTGDRPTDFDPESSTLLVDKDEDTSDRYEYTVTSVLADWKPEELRAASADVPDDIYERYTRLPGNFPGTVELLAEEITRRAETPYDKALALQNYLRSDLFTYDLNVGEGHSHDALLIFLVNTRRGYCEQFAASFAAMARHVGLPARVAIGFTWGINDGPADPTNYRVRGRHAHAWPEVYIGEYGWVPFEPTPGRGLPRAENWLGISSGQDTASGGEADPEELGPDPAADDPGDVTSAGDDARLNEGLLGGGAGASGGGAGDEPTRLPEPVVDALRVLGAGLLVYALVVPTGIAVQRTARRRRARTPAERARYLWREVVDRARSSGVRLPSSLTVAEKAHRLAEVVPGQSNAVHQLARIVEAVNYGELPPSPDEIATAERAAGEAIAELRRRRTWFERLAAYFDARRLFAGRQERLVAHQGAVSDAAVSEAGVPAWHGPLA